MIDRRIFDTLFDKVQMGVFITDADGYFMYVNPMACNMTGYGINEIIGMNRMDLVPVEHKDAAAASFADLKEGKESDSKVCYKTKSGDIRMWGLKSMKVDNDTYVALTEDITELESLITENKKNLNRLKLAGETGKVGSWEYDVRSETFWRSEEAVRQFTGKAEESTSKLDEVEEYLVKKGSLRKAIDLMVRGKKDADKEFEIIDADGNKKVLKTYGRIIMDGDEVSKIIGATVDITEMKEVQAQVTDEKNRLRSYLDIAEVILLVLDNNGKVMMINKKGCEVLGYDEKDILGKSWTDNFIPTYLKKQIEDIHRDNIFKNEESHEKFENPVINSMGEERLISWKNTIIKDKDGIIIGSLSSGRDVTDERRIEKALKESEASLKKAEIMTGSGHFERDLETNISKWSDGMYILLGYEPQSFEVSAENDSELLTPESIKKLESAYHTAIRGNKEFETEIEAIAKDGKILTLHIKAVIEKDGKKPVKMLATCQDITSRKDHLEHIEYISYHDQLTGLYNRRFLEEELNRLDVLRNYPLAVIMADVNGLKLANDTFGHAEGDRMLVNAAEVLKQAVRKDDIIARIGGDEFMILLPKIEKSVVDKIMGRILRDTKAFQTTTLPLSIALGAAIKDNGKTSSDELFKKAEDEMYRNKLHEVSSRRNEAIKIISDTLYEKNEREEAHSERVSQICVMLGTAVGLSRPELNELKTLGLMHDIGKIAVEDEYLNKPDALTQEEFENIKKHPEAGFRILSTSTDMADLAEYVLSHHERWDGKGYPRGLAGEDIPFMARIISIAEAYDAMTNKAPYRRPMPHNKAYLELRKNAGSQFDPVLVKTFLQDVWPDLI